MNREKQWWPSYPLVRLLTAMIAGMLMYDPDIEIHFVLITVTALLLIPASYRIGKTNGPFLLRMRSLPLLLLFFCTGHHLMFLHDEQEDPYWLGHKAQHGSDWLAWVTAPTRTTKSGYQAELQVIAHRNSSSWQPVSGGIWASCQGPKLQEGDTILLFRTPVLVPSALRDTNGFWAHLGHRNIHHRIWLREGDWQLVAPAQDHRPSFKARSVIKGVLDSLFLDSTVRDMAGALLIGERTQLAPELKQAYIQTGVIHVIAISGMHLALIYAMLTGILRFMRKGRGQWLYIVICLGFLWLYAWICGSTPSVLRSAWMFSFLLAGEALDREQQTGNSLAAAALVMLCADPALLYDLGFQLSYAAVASLLIYQQPFRHLCMPENRLLHFCWDLIATTLAAQVLTTPLVLYHFGRFPILFLLANLLAVPLSGIILFLLCVACLLYPLGGSGLPALIAEHMIIFMNSRILGLADTPLADMGNIHLSLKGLCTAYLLLLSLTLWERSKKR
jgi:competence protein ComEC